MKKEDRQYVRLEDIAKKAGVSRSTVTRALQNHPNVSKQARKAVDKAIKELDYHPNPFISSLMVHIRRGKSVPSTVNVAFLTLHEDNKEHDARFVEDLFRQGAKARCEKLGLTMDSINAPLSQMPITELNRILKARGIFGVIIPYLNSNILESMQNEFDFNSFCCVSLGIQSRMKFFHSASNNQFQSTRLAHQTLKEKGYQRIGFLIESYLDDLVDRRFTSGFLSWFKATDLECRESIFLSNRRDRDKFIKWYETWKPDAILTGHVVAEQWAEEIKQERNPNLGIATIHYRKEKPELSGINQNTERVGAAAADLIVSQILHHGNDNDPRFSQNVLLDGEWVDGKSTKMQ